MATPTPETQRLLDDSACLDVQPSFSDDDATTASLSSLSQYDDEDDDDPTPFPPLTQRWRGTERRWSPFRFAALLDDLLLGIGLISAVANGVLVAIAPLTIGETIGNLSATPLDATVAVAAASRLFSIACWVFVLRFVSTMTLDKAAKRQVTHLYREAAHRVVHGTVVPQPKSSNLEWLVGPQSIDESTRLRQGMGRTLGDFVRSATQAVIAFVVAMSLDNGMLSLLMVAIMPLYGTLIVYLIHYHALASFVGIKEPNAVSMSVDRDVQDLKNSIVQQSVEQMRTVAALNAQDKLLAFALGVWKHDETSVVRVSFNSFGPVVCVVAHILFTLGVTVWFGFSLAATSPVDRFCMLCTWVVVIASGLQTWAKYKDGNAVWSMLKTQLFPILDTEPVVDASAEHGIVPEECQGAIVFHDVTAKVGGEHLKEFDYTIDAGTTVPLEYSHGDLTWSFVSVLLQRFCGLQSGEITLDGIDIEDLNVHWLRQQIAVLNNDPIVFNALSVSDNIAIGGERVTRARAIAAAKRAHVHDVIMALPRQYNTIVGEMPPNLLTRDFRHLLVIARVIARNPKILILDFVSARQTGIVKDALMELLDTSSVTTIVLSGSDDYARDKEEAPTAEPTKSTPKNADDATTQQRPQTHQPQPTDEQPLPSARSLVRLLAPQAQRLSLAMLAALVCGMAFVWFLAALSDPLASMVRQYGVWQASQDTADHAALDGFSVWSLTLVAGGTIGVSLLASLAHWAWALVQAKVMTHSRTLYFRALCRQEIRYFEERSSFSPPTFYGIAHNVGKCGGSMTAVSSLVASVLVAATVLAVTSSGDSLPRSQWSRR